jgi:VWFA-related protein
MSGGQVLKRILAFTIAAALAVPALAQNKNPEPELPKLSENMEIRLINVDVVVTDKRGNPIHGLTKDDFELYENNVLKPISNFYEVEGSVAKNVDGEAPSAAPATAAAPDAKKVIPEEMKRRIIFYVDNLSLAPFNRNRVFDQMKEFVRKVMRPGDEAMVATYNRSMKVRVQFTRDPAQIISTLDGLKGESGMGIGNRSERKQVEDRVRDASSYYDAIATARSYAASVEHDLRQSVASINSLMATLAGVEGKKILVLTSEGFPMQPGRELFYFIDDVGREKGWQNVGSSMLEGMSFDGTQLIQSVAKTANANGITMYTVHAAGMVAGQEVSAENQTAISPLVANAAITNTTESMQMMAEMTGGVASVQTNNFNLAFNRISTDLDSYYSLGYRAGTQRVDRQRYLRVKMKNKDYRARSRQTFVEKSVYAEMNDRVIANLLYRGKDNDLGVIARIGSPRPTEDGYYRVPIDVLIPMQKLTLLPQGETEYVGGFDVYVVVANKDNDMSDVARKTHQLHVPVADFKNLGGKFYTYTLELMMEKGLNKISVGVVDQVSNESGFVREQIIAKDMR